MATLQAIGSAQENGFFATGDEGNLLKIPLNSLLQQMQLKSVAEPKTGLGPIPVSVSGSIPASGPFPTTGPVPVSGSGPPKVMAKTLEEIEAELRRQSAPAAAPVVAPIHPLLQQLQKQQLGPTPSGPIKSCEEIEAELRQSAKKSGGTPPPVAVGPNQQMTPSSSGPAPFFIPRPYHPLPPNFNLLSGAGASDPRMRAMMMMAAAGQFPPMPPFFNPIGNMRMGQRPPVIGRMPHMPSGGNFGIF